MKVGSGTVVRANVCSNVCDFYSCPLSSRQLGIWKFSEWTQTNVIVPIELISTKLMVLPADDDGNKVQFPLLQTKRYSTIIVVCLCLYVSTALCHFAGRSEPLKSWYCYKTPWHSWTAGFAGYWSVNFLVRSTTSLALNIGFSFFFFFFPSAHCILPSTVKPV